MKKVLPLLALVLLALPGKALAQTISVTINDSTTPATSGSEFSFHQAACQQAEQGVLNNYNLLTMDWAVSTTATYQAFWSTDPACDITATTDGGGNNIAISNTGTENQITVNGETILMEVTGLAEPCGSTANGTVYICITGTQPDAVATEGELTLTPFDLEFDYDMNPPAAPTQFSVTAADSQLDCSWNFPYTAPPISTGDTTQISDTGDNADHFILYAQQDSSLVPSALGSCGYAGDDGGVEVVTDGGIIGATVNPSGWPYQVTVSTPSSDTSSATISGSPSGGGAPITNGICYDVTVIAFYPDGTQGIAAPVQAEAPIEIFDYWRLYHSAGGTDDGGVHCQSAGGGLVPLALAAAGLIILKRRRRRG